MEKEEKFFDMIIDGQKRTVSEKVLNARGMRERKVEVEINGKIIRVSEHMLSDIAKFGGTSTKRTVKNPPVELLQMPKKVILPVVKLEVKEIKPLPKEEKIILDVTDSNVSATAYPGDVEPEKKVRKTPVRSKAKK